MEYYKLATIILLNKCKIYIHHCSKISFVLQDCNKLEISFHLLIGYAKDVLPQFVTDNDIGGVVTDFSPLRTPMQWVDDVTTAIPKNIPICQVQYLEYFNKNNYNHKI